MYTVQPSGFGETCLLRTHSERADAEGVGGGKLIAHSCVEWWWWWWWGPSGVLDKVQGLVDTEPAVGPHTRRHEVRNYFLKISLSV